MKKIAILLTLFVVSFAAQAQQRRSTKQKSQREFSQSYWTIGVGIGIGNYFGDLAPREQYTSSNISYTRPSISFEVAKRLGPRATVEFELGWVRLQGSDIESADPKNIRHRYRYIRNASFRNDLFELSAMYSYDLKRSLDMYYRRDTWRPYIFGGVAGFYHNPKTQVGGTWVALQPLGTEGQGLPNYKTKYSLVSIAIPFGLGIKYKLRDDMDLAFEVGYRYTFTDYLDDVSGNYADATELSPLAKLIAFDRIADGGLRDFKGATDDLSPLINVPGGITVNGFGAKGDQRGNSNDKDVYVVTSVRLNYILGAGVRCPKFRR